MAGGKGSGKSQINHDRDFILIYSHHHGSIFKNIDSKNNKNIWDPFK